MSTIELKSSFHSLIDSIDNESLLLSFYNLMKSRTATMDGQLWNILSISEQEELLLAFEESSNNNNLLSHKEMKEKHQKWLQ